MTLQIFNVLGREKQEFVPIEPGRVNMYVCGPTVQDYAHVGHAKTYVNFDMVIRWLRYSGWDVLYVQNITDVGHLLDTGEDRILKKARQLTARPMQIVEFYTRKYFADMDALGVTRPDISPRASAHIPEQIEMIEVLLEKGNAYESEGNVYFDVRSHDSYGKLSNRRLEDQEAGARDAVRGEKRNPEDFALWKRAEPEHILRWNSPWGVGFPGWHIECSAMSAKYLGETFDIHGGGVDNIFPHNECEIAQSEAAHNGASFANYWMLGGSLNVPDADGIPIKMSKSLGNFFTISDALEKWRPEAIRLFMFSAHYTNPVVFGEDSLDGATRGWERLYSAARLTRSLLPQAPEGDEGNAILEVAEKTRADFAAAMNDDFNAPIALSALQTFTREVNTLLNSETNVGRNMLEAINAVYNDLGGTVLGIIPETEAASGGDAAREEGLIKLLVDLRTNARANKDYATGDIIRDQLAELDVTLEDRADGTVWKVG